MSRSQDFDDGRVGADAAGIVESTPTASRVPGMTESRTRIGGLAWVGLPSNHGQDIRITWLPSPKFVRILPPPEYIRTTWLPPPDLAPAAALSLSVL